MAFNGIFDKGVWSCGFDMDPTGIEIFTQSAPGGSATTAGTPFGSGYCWSGGNNTNGILLNTNLTTLIVGFRINLNGTFPASQIFCSWYDATAGAIQVSLRVLANGQLQFYLGSGTGTALGSPSALGTMQNSVWTWIEAKVTISATVGVVECYVNGTQVITASSLNTKSTANTFVNAFQLQGATNPCQFDDWYMLDTTGSAPLNTYLGNIRVAGSVASGAGAHTQFTPTNPTNVNYSNTANVPANTAQYNADATVGDIDSYAFPAIPFSPVSVLFLNHWYKVELDTAGARTVVPGIRSGGSDTFDANQQTPSNGTYKYFNMPWVLDPNTSAAWTVTNAGNAELSLKIAT